VTVNLATGRASGTQIGSDTLSAIENVIGGQAGDRITGNSAANRLDGHRGADTLTGGDGSDTYSVDSPGDVVIETNATATGGTDTVIATVTRTLGNHQENLTLAGTAAINGTGNGLNNRMTGNGAANRLSGGSGNDTLIGGLGSDTLTGGSGADRFKFVKRSEGTDRLTDFASGEDKIQVVSANFGLAEGTLPASRFVRAGTALTSTAAVFLYNATTGALAFDSNGNRAGGVSQIAILTGPKTLVASDIHVVAA
jgi:Ca2+-binding RTX toxin-like protein